MIGEGRTAAAGVVLVTLAGRALSLLGLVLLARLLDQRTFGQVVTLTALFGLASLIADFGTAERLVQQAGRAGSELASGLGARLTMGIFGACALSLAAAVADRTTAWSVALFSCGLALPLVAVVTNRVVVDRVEARPVRAASWNIAPTIVPLLGALLGVLIEPTMRAAATGALVVTATLAAAASKPTRAPLRLTGLRSSAHVAWEARHLAATAVCVAVYSRADRLVLSAVSGPEAAGRYTAAYTLVFGFSLLGPALAWTSLPHLSRLSTTDQWRQSVDSRLRLAIVAGAIAASLFLLLAPTASHVVFGAAYGISHTSLIAFALLTFLYVVNPMISTALISCECQAFVSHVAVANTLLACFLFPLSAWIAAGSGLAVASATIETGGLALLSFRVVRLTRRDEAWVATPA